MTKLLLHPLTGEPIIPVGLRSDGRPIWPIIGAAPEDDGEDDAGEDDAGDAGSGEEDSGGDDNTTSGSDDGSDTVSRAELDNVLARMKAADQRATKAENELKKHEDAQKDELTRATDRVTELETENKELKELVSGLRFGNAFFSANKHQWQDAEIARDIAERKGYLDGVVDDEGEVDTQKLGKALDRLAKEHSYLVKPASGGASGEPAVTRSNNNKDDKARQQELRRKFPALGKR